MGITDFALNNSRTVIMLQVLIVGLGLYLFPNFPRLEDPPIIIREALVAAQYPGMPPDRVERLITRPIEEEIRTMGEVKDIKNSQSKFGESIIHVVIKDEVPSSELPAVWKQLRNKMSDVSRKLPDGTVGPFVNDEFGDTAVATIALWSDGFSMEEMREVARATRERLAKLKGLKKIDLYGVQEERIYLDISDSKLKALGIDPSEIGQALREQNVIIPGGKLNINDMELIVEPTGQFKTMEEIGELLIHFKNTEGKESSIRLKDVATVKKGYVDPVYQPAYFNGRQSIVLAVYMLDGYNAVSFGEELQKQLDRIQRSLPLGYKFDFATYQPYLINKAVNSMVVNVIESLAIVLVVVMLFLGLRTGLIVGFFIPLVMLSGVVGMWVLGISMQRMSLAAMIIALGMLVDNGICVAEEITTRMQEGASAREATLTTGRLLAVPLLTSTLTTVFAFCPILLQAGGAGDYTKSLGIVIAMLLLSSWFLSMFSTTTACSWFVKVKTPEKSTGQTSYMDKFYSFYKWILEFFLAHRLAVVVAVIAVMALSAYGFTFVPITFFPSGDRNQYLIYLDFPAGTRIEETDKTIKEISTWLQDKKANPEITGAIAYVGNGGPRFFLSLAPDDPDPNCGFIIVNTQNSQ